MASSKKKKIRYLAWSDVVIKRHARDTCLCMGGYQAPPAPHFIFLITLSPLGGFFSNLAGVCSSLVEVF